MYSDLRRRRSRQRLTFLVTVLALLLIFTILTLTSLSGDPESAGSSSTSDSPSTPENTESPASNGSDDGSGPDFLYQRAATPETGDDSRPGVWRDKPDSVRGIYLSGYMAGTPRVQEYVDLLDDSGLNAVVVDVKDVTGELMYESQVPLAEEVGANTSIVEDMPGLVRRMNENGIYTIARIPVFEDDILPRQRPDLAVLDTATGTPWVNTMGTAWANAYQREVWDYNVDIAREAADMGFDEIQWDYVRFPSDGPMDRVDYGEAEASFASQEAAVAAFLEYAYSEISPLGVYLAADVFGMIASTENPGIGQTVADIAPHVDVISPMPYPSHFPPGSYGFDNPNAQPYEVIERAMADFHEEAEGLNPDLEIRPWLQDFDMGTPAYGLEEVRAQMQATYDSGETGWLLWNAANEYTREALGPPE